MQTTHPSRPALTISRIVVSDLTVLLLLGLAKFLLHMLTNHQYGWNRDELAVLDDAFHLAWGYVVYPPMTPFVARLGLELFGPSMVGVRAISALIQGGVMVLVGLMVRDLGGGRLAQVVAAVAAGISPAVLAWGAVLQYVSIDCLWWVLIGFCLIRLIKTENPRWWLGVGAAIGLGMMTKYTIAFYVVGIVAGVLLTSLRRYLRSPWLWAGVGLSLLIFLPNLIWQVQHDFVSLEFLGSIHERDVEEGRADSFLIMQMVAGVNAFVLPLWIAGLYFYAVDQKGKRYRVILWAYVVTLILFTVAQGREYYIAPAYPALIAGGAVAGEQWLVSLAQRRQRLVMAITWSAMALGGLVFGAMMLPVAPINSPLWDAASELNENYIDEIGWDDLVATVAEIYNGLPAEERAVTAILAGNYGEAGAINLYGSQYGLPQAISGINNYYDRGYGDMEPQTVITLDYLLEDLTPYFRTCEEVTRITNRYGVENEESVENPPVYLCRGPLLPWEELWPLTRHYG